jgi:hypothetical protein
VIVVDSSVWIAALRGADTAAVRKLRMLAGQQQLAVGDLVMTEVLMSARDQAHAARIERNLRQHVVVGMLSDALAVLAASSCRALREAGVTPRRTIDLLIGTFCLTRGWPLLHDDRDFDAMERVLRLGVV